VLGEAEAIKVFSQTTEEMLVTFRDVYLQSVIGVTGQAAQFGGLWENGPTLNVESSTIVADVGIAMESGQLPAMKWVSIWYLMEWRSTC
jgi:hypothetical protein